jgi:hypothetical protein
MVPINDERPGRHRALAAAPAAAGPGTGTRGNGECRWCGAPAAWSWSFEGDPHVDLDLWSLQDDWRVCAECHALTTAGDDAALLDRIVAVLERRIGYPYAAAFVREQQAARLAVWIARRTTARPC